MHIMVYLHDSICNANITHEITMYNDDNDE